MTQSAHSDVDPEGKPESSCEKSVRLHGLLSRAQFQFGYGSYTRALISQTSDCGREIGDAKLNEKIESGHVQFRREREGERPQGHLRRITQAFPVICEAPPRRTLHVDCGAGESIGRLLLEDAETLDTPRRALLSAVTRGRDVGVYNLRARRRRNCRQLSRGHWHRRYSLRFGSIAFGAPSFKRLSHPWRASRPVSPRAFGSASGETHRIPRPRAQASLLVRTPETSHSQVDQGSHPGAVTLLGSAIRAASPSSTNSIDPLISSLTSLRDPPCESGDDRCGSCPAGA